MTTMIFRWLAAGAAAISFSAAAADGEKQPQSQSQAQGQSNAQANQNSEVSRQMQDKPSTAPQAASVDKPGSPDTSVASIASASNPVGGPSSSSERTAEPAPGGYGPPAGEPPSDKK